MKIRVEGLEAAEERVDSLREKAEQLTKQKELATRIHTFLVDKHKQLFDSEGRSEGFNWPQYDPRYQAFRERYTPNTKMLRWKGGKERLYPSVVDPNHRDHVWKTSATSWKFGTSVPYADEIHEGKGTGRFGENRKARPFIGLGKDSVSELAEMVAKWMIEDSE